eukprot:4912398-Prymnesium_polylepis.1
MADFIRCTSRMIVFVSHDLKIGTDVSSRMLSDSCSCSLRCGCRPRGPSKSARAARGRRTPVKRWPVRVNGREGPRNVLGVRVVVRVASGPQVLRHTLRRPPQSARALSRPRPLSRPPSRPRAHRQVLDGG